MKIREIKRIITEMDTDLSGKQTLADSKYEFLADCGKIEEAFNENKKVRFIAHKRNMLKNIDPDNMEIDDLRRIEEYLTVLNKKDYFSEEEIDSFLKICNA